MPTITTKDGTRNLLQGLGPEGRPADRVPPRLAARAPTTGTTR